MKIFITAKESCPVKDYDNRSIKHGVFCTFIGLLMETMGLEFLFANDNGRKYFRTRVSEMLKNHGPLST